MNHRGVKLGIIATVLPHLFCCVLPIVLAIISLFAHEVAHSSYFIPEWLEPWVFVFSALMLGLSWIFVVRDCKCECDTCHNGTHHRPQKMVLSVITIIFIISVVLHIISHH